MTLARGRRNNPPIRLDMMPVVAVRGAAEKSLVIKVAKLPVDPWANELTKYISQILSDMLTSRRQQAQASSAAQTTDG